MFVSGSGGGGGGITGGGTVASGNFISFGAAAATAGVVRLSTNSGICIRNDSDTTNIDIFVLDGSNNATVGHATGLSTLIFSTADYTVSRAGSFYLQDSAGNTNRLLVSSTLFQFGLPRVGASGGSPNTPYASEGRATQAMADANKTAAASVYSRAIIKCTGALTADRTLTIPLPASEDASYIKVIQNLTTGGFNIVVKAGAHATTVNVASGQKMVLATPDGVFLAN